MLRFFISILVLLCCTLGIAQSEPIDLQQKDTVKQKEAYGLRVGVDLSRPVLSFTNDDYTGIEFVGDYRLTQKIWLAAELGNEKRTDQEDLYNFTTSGSYLKLGVAFSSFSQTLNNYQIFDSDRYFSPDGFATGSTTAEEFTGRNASWIEMVGGMKAELFANIYLGLSIRLAHLITQNDKNLERFPNLWIPGYNKVTDNAKWGVGFNYSISYFIPLYKKAKKKTEKDLE